MIATLTAQNQCPYQVSTYYTLHFLKYGLDKNFKSKVTTVTVKSKVKLRSHHDIAQLQAPTNVSTKYQLHTRYSF